MKLIKKPSLVIALLFLGVCIVLAIVMPLIPSIDPNAFDPNNIEMYSPSVKHLFGTDDLGRDLLIRCIYGARISLSIGFLSVSISVVIGGFIGIISGYLGGWLDELMMRFVDLIMAIPTIFLILIIQVILSPSIYNVIIVIGLTSWMGVARLVRAEVMSIKERVFVTAVKARGIPSVIILFKHILPHALTPVIVAAMLGMGNAILAESVLSFLGLGVQPPHASWGNMLQNSLAYMRDAPWMTIFPGLLITGTVLSLNFIGDALRIKLSPREK